MKPFVESLQTTYSTISVFYIDVAVAEDVVQAFQVTSMPTYCLFQGTTVLDRFSGADKDKLGQLVQAFVGQRSNEIKSL